MIERYSITASADELCERFECEMPMLYQPFFNACPTRLLPVITNTHLSGFSVFYWGTSPEWSKNKTLSEKIINVRNEMFQEKPMLRKMLMRARCLIPADGFYCWKKVGKKSMIPYRFVLSKQGVFSMAGIWEEYEDTDGNEFHTFTIITVPANSLVEHVAARMPAVLQPGEEKAWLSPDTNEEQLLALLRPYAATDMNVYSVSPLINDINKDVPSMIRPSPPADQFGNLTLFD